MSEIHGAGGMIIHYNVLGEGFSDCNESPTEKITDEISKVSCRDCLKQAQAEILLDLNLDIEDLVEHLHDVIPKLIFTHMNPEVLRNLRGIEESLKTFVERS